MDINNVNILGSSHDASFQVYSQTALLVTQMYTKIHNHKHKLIPLAWIHLVHTIYGNYRLVILFCRGNFNLQLL